MAKRKPPQVPPLSIPEEASAKAQEEIATLRKYYDAGPAGQRHGPRRDSEDARAPEGPRRRGRGRGGHDPQGPEVRPTYTAEELEELLALRDADGEPLNWYRVRVLLQVKDKAVRAELQREAALEGWSHRDLSAAVHARQGGKKSPGGRRFSVPESPQQILGRLTELSESWLRFYEDIGEEGGLAEKLRTAKRTGGADRGPEARDPRGGRSAARLAEGREQAGQPPRRGRARGQGEGRAGGRIEGEQVRGGRGMSRVPALLGQESSTTVFFGTGRCS